MQMRVGSECLSLERGGLGSVPQHLLHKELNTTCQRPDQAGSLGFGKVGTERGQEETAEGCLVLI